MFDEVGYFLKTGTLAAVIGGIVSVLLAGVLGMFTGALMSGALLVVLVVAIVYMAKYTEVDALRFGEWVVLFLVIGAVGTFVSAFVPVASAYILSSTAFTVTGLGFTLLYVFIADAIGDKVF